MYKLTKTEYTAIKEHGKRAYRLMGTDAKNTAHQIYFGFDFVEAMRMMNINRDGDMVGFFIYTYSPEGWYTYQALGRESKAMEIETY